MFYLKNPLYYKCILKFFINLQKELARQGWFFYCIKTRMCNIENYQNFALL